MVTAPAGELVLPDSLKNLPLMISSILKLPCFQEEASTQKCQTYALLFRYLMSSIDLTSILLYTRIWCFTTDPPSMVPASIERLSPHQCYLMDTGTDLSIFPGSEITIAPDCDVSEQLQHLSKGSDLARAVLAWSEHLQSQRASTLPRARLRLMKHLKPMAEDASGSNPCYADWLCALHVRLQT